MNVEKKNNSVGVIVILVVLVILLGGYIVFDNFIKNNSDNITEESSKKESNNSMEEVNLDINSNLVQFLYAKVSNPSTSNSCNAEWFFNDVSNESKNLTVASMTEKQKMNLVGLNLNSSKEQNIECDNSIPDTSNYYMSVCYAYKDKYVSQTGYSKKYVETVYKSLFGENAVMTNESIITPDSIYIYNNSKDMYIKYLSESGSLIGTTCGPISYKLELEKAVKKDNSVLLYEKRTETNQEYENNGTVVPAGTKTSVNIYTFKLDNDGIYRFVSKNNE